MIDARKITTTTETIQFEQGRKLPEPITRIAGLAVITNPFAGQFTEDLSGLFKLGGTVGEELSDQLTKQLTRPMV